MQMPQRIQCFPGNIGLLDSSSAKIHPTDQTSTGTFWVKCKARHGKLRHSSDKYIHNKHPFTQ